MVEIKKDANAKVVLNKLFKMTQLQTSFSVNNVALVDGRPRTLNLKEILQAFVDHRRDVVLRRTRFDLKKAEERAHILKGLMIATDNIDEVIHIIRSSQTTEEARSRLAERFGLDDIQTRAIVEMRLRQLTGLEMEKLREEYEELMKLIAFYNEILSNEDTLHRVMREELEEVRDKYGDERKTRINPFSGDFNSEDFYSDDPMIITISHMGYIKRTPLRDFRSQHRGGVGSKGSSTRDEDFIEHIYPATNHNYMLFFTQKGRCYWLKVYDLPEMGKSSKGRAIQNLLQIDPDDRVNAFIRVPHLLDPDYNSTHNLIFATKKGVIKKTSLAAYAHPRAIGVNAIVIREDDEVIEVRLTDGNADIIMADRDGRAIRFHESKVRTMGRVSAGVRGMTLGENGDEVIGMIAMRGSEEETVMVVSSNGYGKRTNLEDYRITNRGGKGVKTLNITEKTGDLVAIKNVDDSNDLMIINQSGVTLRMHVADIKVQGRATQGVKLIDLGKRGDTIASVCKVDAEPDDDVEQQLDEEKREEEIARAENRVIREAEEFEDSDANETDDLTVDESIDDSSEE